MVPNLLQSQSYVPIPKSELSSDVQPTTSNKNELPLVFNANPRNPSFSSVQFEIKHILEEHAAQKKAAESKRRKEIFTLVGPILLLLGGLSWMLKGLPANIDKKLFGRFVKSAEPEKVINNAFNKLGMATIGAGTAFIGANGILAGTTSGQPSMVISNILQVVPSSILLTLMFKTNKGTNGQKAEIIRNIALSTAMATGAMFTVGFANEIRNKDDETRSDQKRVYDMDRFKSLTNPKSNIPLSKRLTGILSELGKMTGFTLTDHIRLLKNIPSDIRQIANNFRPHAQQHPDNNTLKKWFTEPSADKSELAALFFYLGALPVLLFSYKMPHLTNSRLYQAIISKLPTNITENALFKHLTKPVTEIAKGKTVTTLKRIGILLGNLSLFSIALNRQDFRGKAPLIGVPMAVVGMASGKQFFQGMGNAGESVNNLLFSDIAVNGLETDSTKQESTIQQETILKPSIRFSQQSPNPSNPFQSFNLTKRYQIN